MERELFRGTRPLILVTDLLNPSEGRIFVWAWTQWFERIGEDSGAVTFTHVADSEPELRRWLSQQQPVELSEPDEDFAEMVREEFLEQEPLFPEAPENSSEEPFREQNPEEDIEHV